MKKHATLLDQRTSGRSGIFQAGHRIESGDSALPQDLLRDVEEVFSGSSVTEILRNVVVYFLNFIYEPRLVAIPLSLFNEFVESVLQRPGIALFA